MVPTSHQDRLHGVPSAARQSLQAVLTDVLGAPGAAATIRFHGPSTPEYQGFVAGEPAAPQVEVLGETAGHTFRLVVGDGGAGLAVAAAGILQDDVMDELGAPWPEVAAPGGGTTVLEPAVSASGVAEWRGTAVRCPIGALQRTFGNAIRHFS
jgi:hypothetical protein